MSRRIGIMGGTFNPIHNGHLNLIRQAREEYQLDLVWLMPTGRSPHKDVYGHVGRYDRLRMCQIASFGMDRVQTCAFEVDRPGASFTYLTLQRLSEFYTNEKIEFYYIIGEDSLDQFDTWIHPEIICQKAKILVACRSPQSAQSPQLRAKMKEKSERYQGSFMLLGSGYMEVSSSQIRKKLEIGEEVSSYLPGKVLHYIREHALYQENTQHDLASIQKDLQLRLSAHRYEHTLGVMHTAAALAMRYSYPIDKAKLAGLLHDCAKYLSGKELLSIAREKACPISQAEESAPALLHAKVGAIFARERYGVNDSDVLEAIRLHTTGSPAMRLLSRILFVADYIEPGRDRASHLDDIRQVAFRDLDLAIGLILEDTLSYLKEKNCYIDPMSQYTYDFYRDLLEERREYDD